jgi:hypothetical protein
MLTRIMKWFSVTILIPALFWNPNEGYIVAMQLIVTASCALIAWQGFRAHRELWAAGFVVIACLFNPFQPMIFSRGAFLVIGLLSLSTFLASRIAFNKTQQTEMITIAM